MASLHHPNICEFVGVCAETRPQGKQFILSKLMMGSLFDLIHRPARINQADCLTVVVAVNLSQGISAGIAYLHGKNLVHADLKSPNILINPASSSGCEPSYVPRICDFGHAAVRAVPSPHSRLCTPQWAAPEALRCESLGPAADIYSFGVILWEMLVCQIPHADLAFGQVQASVGWGELIPDQSLLPPLPCELSRILRLCLRFVPADRPPAQMLRRHFIQLPRSVQRAAKKQLKDFLGVQDRRNRRPHSSVQGFMSIVGRAARSICEQSCGLQCGHDVSETPKIPSAPSLGVSSVPGQSL